MNAQCPRKWWSTLKSAVFGSSSDSTLPPLIGRGGCLVSESVGKAEMLSVHFDGKQSRDPVDLPSTVDLSVYRSAATHTLSGRTGSAFPWRSEGRTFASQSVQ